VWPYDLDARYEDGWGFSNAPPTVAGVIALVLSANRSLPTGEVRRLLIETAGLRDGFRVLDAEAAVAAAVARRGASSSRMSPPVAATGSSTDAVGGL
jgi:hypothetical protein